MPVRRRGLTGVAAGVAMAVVAGAFAAPALAGEYGEYGEYGERHRATREAMEAALNADAPGVTVQARDRHGDKHGEWNAAAGIGDLERQSPRGAHDRYRVGSVTKTFVSTVLLQLVAEKELRLDDTVGRWLPGVVEGHGHDGDKITVRRLLNHTSGVFDVARDPGFREKVFSEKFLAHRYDTWTPAQQVAVAMGNEPHFKPGKGWKYSNTNYLLAAMIIEKVTGETYADAIERRIIEPLGLSATSLPGTDPRMPAPASRAYMKLSGAPDAKTHDVTELNPSVAGPAGEMISSSADLNRFYSALLRGEILPGKQLAEMKRTVLKDKSDPRERYGLGLESRRTPCGTVVWGHDGDIHGSSSEVVGTEDGRHMLALNFNGPEGDRAAVIDAEFCGK
ncbi:serine hydrolase domain-containing protein [Streptomyces sp. SYP-A7185]|uniref:serine hydrolase domain-containing protein n=1 Tax=Streptomyces sp. SYP-A7185 TaxID=3040076 RepID=UPI0038F70AEE